MAMAVTPLLEKLRDEIQTKVPRIGEGNCFISVRSMPVLRYGRVYVELFYDGSRFDWEDGGNLNRTWTLGIAIRNLLVIDSKSGLEGSSKELLALAEGVLYYVHLWYDKNLVAQPIIAKSESSMTPSQGERGEHVIEQRYEVVQVVTYSELKEE